MNSKMLDRNVSTVQTTASRLLSLPAELRLQIFREVLHDTVPQWTTPCGMPESQRQSFDRLQHDYSGLATGCAVLAPCIALASGYYVAEPALMRSCKAIRNDTRLLYFEALAKLSQSLLPYDNSVGPVRHSKAGVQSSISLLRSKWDRDRLMACLQLEELRIGAELLNGGRA